MFNRAIDSKLCGCHVVALKVGDVVPHGMTVDRTMVRKSKTGHPVYWNERENLGWASIHICQNCRL